MPEHYQPIGALPTYTGALPGHQQPGLYRFLALATTPPPSTLLGRCIPSSTSWRQFEKCQDFYETFSAGRVSASAATAAAVCGRAPPLTPCVRTEWWRGDQWVRQRGNWGKQLFTSASQTGPLPGRSSH